MLTRARDCTRRLYLSIVACMIGQLETRAFSVRLSRSDLEKARILWALFAEAKVALTAFHAVGAISAATGPTCPGTDEIAAFMLTRLRSILERIEPLTLSDDTRRRLFVASLRDLIAAVDRLSGADTAGLLITATVAYEAGRKLAEPLWALELAPEGAPLSASAKREFVA